MSNDKITSTTEAWESRELGQDEEFVQIARDVNENLIDESLELQMISIRLQKSLIDDFKMLALIHGIGYQPLIKQALKRFAEGEKKCLLRKVAEKLEEDKAHDEELSSTVVEERKVG